MAITVGPASSTITITQVPDIIAPVYHSHSHGDKMILDATLLAATGQCQISGGVGDSPAGWTLGFILVQWIETNWAYYRGEKNTDGSSFIQRARPPARSAQGCRDTITPGTVYYHPPFNFEGKAGRLLPLTMNARFEDRPGASFHATNFNHLTNKENYLREIQLEFHFCTILSLREPLAAGAPPFGATYHHLKHFMWNLHWQVTFQPSDFFNLSAQWDRTSPAGTQNSANIGAVHDGGPTDARYTRLLTASNAPNCNNLARTAAEPVARDKNTWGNFDVKR